MILALNKYRPPSNNGGIVLYQDAEISHMVTWSCVIIYYQILKHNSFNTNLNLDLYYLFLHFRTQYQYTDQIFIQSGSWILWPAKFSKEYHHVSIEVLFTMISTFLLPFHP